MQETWGVPSGENTGLLIWGRWAFGWPWISLVHPFSVWPPQTIQASGFIKSGLTVDITEALSTQLTLFRPKASRKIPYVLVSVPKKKQYLSSVSWFYKQLVLGHPFLLVMFRLKGRTYVTRILWSALWRSHFKVQLSFRCQQETGQGPVNHTLKWHVPSGSP